MEYGPQPYTPFESITPDLLPDNFFASDTASWLGPVSKGLSLASSILGAARSFKAAGEFGGQARDYREMARLSLERGFQTGIDIQREGDEFVGTMTASFGKSGSLMEGSPLLVIADTRSRITENVERAIEQGRIEFKAYRRAAQKAESASRSAKIGGIGQVLGGVGALIGGPFTLIGAGITLGAGLE